jgi:hypothetical protein
MNQINSQDIIAYCGLVCSGCQIYLATREQDRQKQKEMRIEIARLCREHYAMDVKLEDVTDCDGCRTETGRLFSGCAKCDIRKCVRQRNLDSCAYCPDYVCENLQKLFVTDEKARARLDLIRSTTRSG